MAVVEVRELTDRPGEATGEERTQTRTFRVRVDSRSDTIATIALAASAIPSSTTLPTYLSPHPEDVFLTCRSLSIKPETDHWQWWIATARYSTAPLSQREKEKQIANPLDRPAKIRWSSREEVEGMFVDLDGNAMVNSAGDFYDPPAERIVNNWTAVVEKNVAQCPYWFRDYPNAVNSDTINIDGLDFPPGTVRLAQPTLSEEMEENDVTYRVLTMTLETKRSVGIVGTGSSNYGQILDRRTKLPVDAEPWDAIVPDMGLRELVPSGGTGTGTATPGSVRNIEDSNGNQINAPIALDGDGYKLDDPSPSNVFYFRHRRFDRLPFSILPLT